jgi:uncharacterized protein (TIGR02996 family)
VENPQVISLESLKWAEWFRPLAISQVVSYHWIRNKRYACLGGKQCPACTATSNYAARRSPITSRKYIGLYAVSRKKYIVIRAPIPFVKSMLDTRRAIMMTDHHYTDWYIYHPGGEPFLQSIMDTPEDDTARLVYADWLDEHGQYDKAAVARRFNTNRLVDGYDIQYAPHLLRWRVHPRHSWDFTVSKKRGLFADPATVLAMPDFHQVFESLALSPDPDGLRKAVRGVPV